MSKYKGLFTFDVENHRYVTVGAADGIIDCMDYKPSEPAEPLIKDEKIRKAVRSWAEACDVERCHYDGDGDFATRWHGIKLDCSQIELDGGHYTIAELCGEEE